MDISLASIIKTALIIAVILPFFAIWMNSLSTNVPAPLQQNSTISIKNLTLSMNQTSTYIERNFLLTTSGLNTTLDGPGGSFSANVTTVQAFAFILQGFGTLMKDTVQLPLLDLASMNYIVTAMSFALPQFAVGIIKLGMDLLYAYMLISMLMLGVSMIEKYDMKN